MQARGRRVRERPASGSGWYHGAIKLACDILIAALALLVLAPLMVCVAASVMLSSSGPPFYRALRVGWRGRPVYILKFRKMKRGSSGPPLTLADDGRFTRVGRWLASTKLDELPQLFNVVRGQMSLVGPRPEDPNFVEYHREAFAPILAARPGITGLSQLAFAAESRILDPREPIRDYEERILPQKLELDRFYVSHRHLMLDVRILWWTFVRTVLAIPVSVDRSTGRIRVRSSGGRRHDTQTALHGVDLRNGRERPFRDRDVQPAETSTARSLSSVTTNVPTP